MTQIHELLSKAEAAKVAITHLFLKEGCEIDLMPQTPGETGTPFYAVSASNKDTDEVIETAYFATDEEANAFIDTLMDRT